MTMPIKPDSCPVYFINSDSDTLVPKALSAQATQWIEATGFAAKEGEVCLLPGPSGSCEAVLFGLGKKKAKRRLPCCPVCCL